MAQRRLASALLPLAFALTGVAQAADPEFTTGRVLESRAYEKETGSVVIGGIRSAAGTEWTSRVTVVIDGTRITGEWAAKTSISATAKDFPRGSDVTVAVRRNQLLLKDSDGGTVTAKIVRRVEPRDNERRD